MHQYEGRNTLTGAGQGLSNTNNSVMYLQLVGTVVTVLEALT